MSITYATSADAVKAAWAEIDQITTDQLSSSSAMRAIIDRHLALVTPPAPAKGDAILAENCVFVGPPPVGFANWDDALSATPLRGLRISDAKSPDASVPDPITTDREAIQAALHLMRKERYVGEGVMRWIEANLDHMLKRVVPTSNAAQIEEAAYIKAEEARIKEETARFFKAEVDRLATERNLLIVHRMVLASVLRDALELIPPGISNCHGDKCRMANCEACVDIPTSNDPIIDYLKRTVRLSTAPFAWFHAVPWNELAAVLDAAEENDPALWIREKHREWSEGFLTSLTQDHYGDCTKAPTSCLRCHAEDRKRKIDAMRAALTPPKPGATHE